MITPLNLKNKRFYRNQYVGLILLLALFLTSCQDKPEKNFFAGRAQGSTFHITYFGGNSTVINKGIDSIFTAINESMSTYIETSDISRINNGDTTVVVDDMFVDVFEASRLIYEQTKGIFDPTIGKLVNYYGFGPEKLFIDIDTTHVDSLVQYVGLDKIKITANHHIQKTNPNIYIDFNAIAQGYTTDVIGSYLEAHKRNNFLVEVGGEIMAKGINLASGAPWRVGIDDPQQTGQKRRLKAIIQLKNAGMATSGNYRKFRIDSVTGKKYVHTIDANTGYPARNRMLSATVISKTCMMADGYATAFMAMGIDEAKQFVNTLPNVEAYFIYAKHDSIASFMTDGFKEMLLEKE